MTTIKESRPHARGGSQDNHINTATVRPATDVTENLQSAARLVRLLETQHHQVERAYRRGWEDCGHAMAYMAEEVWRAGYEASESAMDAAWKPVARAVRAGAEKAFPAWQEKRQRELDACKPRPGDFPGLQNDPHCLDRLRAASRTEAAAA